MVLFSLLPLTWDKWFTVVSQPSICRGKSTSVLFKMQNGTCLLHNLGTTGEPFLVKLKTIWVFKALTLGTNICLIQEIFHSFNSRLQMSVGTYLKKNIVDKCSGDKGHINMLYDKAGEAGDVLLPHGYQVPEELREEAQGTISLFQWPYIQSHLSWQIRSTNHQISKT